MKTYLLKHYFKLFIVALFLVAQFAVGQTTVTYTFSVLGGSNVNNPSGNIDANISYTSAQNAGSTAATYNSGGLDLRLYYSAANPRNGSSITLIANNGVTITGVEFESVSTTYMPTMRYIIGTETVTTSNPAIARIGASAVYTVSGLNITNNMTIRNANTTNEQMRMLYIKVTYTPVVAAAPVVTGGTISATYGSSMTDYQISATGTPTSYTVATGTLPAGLSLNGTTGIISGTPTVSGNSSITVTATNSNGTSSPATLNFNIAKKNLTIFSLTADNKIQDGNTTATLSGTAALSGVLPADVGNVTLSGTPTAVFADANVGNGKTVIVSGYSLSGSKAANYTLTQPTLTANITALAAPVATAATSVATTSFDANWNAVSGATGYYLDVYKTGASAPATDLFISEYVEGSSNNKYIEIFNGTGSNVDLSNYDLVQYNNGGTSPGASLQLTGTLANNSTYVIANNSANIYSGANLSSSSNVMQFNGNDEVALRKAGINIDVVGIIGSGSADFAKDVTLTRKSTISSPTTSYNELDWTTSPTDNVANLGMHTFSGGISVTFISGFENLNVGNVTTKTVTGLAPATNYKYRVRAVSGTATSANSNVIDVTTLASTPITWNGSAWSNANVGPTSADDVIINGNYNIAAAFEAKNVTINSGYALIVNNSVKAVNVTNNGDIIVANNANFVQTGTFTPGTGSTFIVSRATQAVKRQAYIAWSSPLNGSSQTLKAFSYGKLNGVNQSTTGTLDNRFYVYDNGTYVATSSVGTFDVPGKGFQIRAPNDFTTNTQIFHGLFEGSAPNTGNITYNASTITGQYVFLGNPYPSALDLNAFYASNNQITGTFYTWDSSAELNGSTYSGSTYKIYNQTGVVPAGTVEGYAAVGQGFFVDRGINTINDFYFNDAMRSATQTGSFAKAAVTDRFWLKMASSTGAPQMLFAFSNDATAGLDNGYDGKMIDTNPDTFYTKVNGEKMTIDTHAAFQSSDQFDVFINSTVSKNYTISIVQKDGLFNNGGQAIYLKDKTNGVITDLSTADYTFTSTGTGEENRFEVYFTNAVLGTANAVKEDINIYGNKGVLYVESPKDIDSVKVYDLSGRLLLNMKGQGKVMKTSINASKIVLVSVELQDGSIVSKKVKL